MIGWSIVFIIIALFFFFCLIRGRKNDTWHFTAFLVALVEFLIAIIILVGTLSYIQFEASFNITKQQCGLAESGNSAVLIIDIAEANKQLADYQAFNQLFGIFSFAPDRVNYITPIGLAETDP